jgi:hypothetical protein
MASNLVHITRRGFGETTRKDLWWVGSLATFLGFSAFIVYSTWAAFQGAHYSFGPYLSPMYSPLIWEAAGQPLSHHSWLGAWPSWMPNIILPITPAFLILWAPGGFRFTCYYYRGERKFPLNFQNIHRYFLYVAIIFIGILAYDAMVATQFSNGFGIGVGTIVMSLNVILLGSYTFGCHSLRHLVGGRCDTMSDKPLQQSLWRWVTILNRRHMLFAWMSLFWVGFTDFYIRMCSMGVFTDYRLL